MIDWEKELKQILMGADFKDVEDSIDDFLETRKRLKPPPDDWLKFFNILFSMALKDRPVFAAMHVAFIAGQAWERFNSRHGSH